MVPLAVLPLSAKDCLITPRSDGIEGMAAIVLRVPQLLFLTKYTPEPSAFDCT